MKILGTISMCIIFFFLFLGGWAIQEDITERYRISHFYQWQPQPFNAEKKLILAVSHKTPVGKGAIFASDDKFFISLPMTDDIAKAKMVVNKVDKSHLIIDKQKVFMKLSNISYEKNKVVYLPIKNIHLLVANDRHNHPIYYFLQATDLNEKKLQTGMIPSDNQQSDSNWFFGVMLFSIGYSVWGIWMLKKSLEKTLKVPNVPILITKIGVKIQMIFMALLGISAILKLPIAF